MATIVKRALSGSNNSRPITVSSTAGATPQTIHTGASSTSITDEVWLYAHSTYSATVELRIEFGSTATAAHIVCQVPARDTPVLVVPGLILQNSASNDAIFAHIGGLNGSASPAGGLIHVSGYVNRITQ